MRQDARSDCGPQPRRAITAPDRTIAVSTKTLGVSIGEETGNGSYMHDAEMIAQELSLLGHKVEDVEKRLADVEKGNRRPEDAALITARALQEISGHWDAVYEAMRRRDESQEAS
jgi:hypothetical protein